MRYILILIIILLSGCARKPMDYIPKNQRAMLNKQRYNQMQYGNKKISIAQMLSSIKKQSLEKNPNGIIGRDFLFAYQSNQVLPNKNQFSQIKHILNRLEKENPYMAEITVSSLKNGDALESLLIAQKRSRELERILSQKLSDIQIFYKPQLARGKVILKLKPKSMTEENYG